VKKIHSNHFKPTTSGVEFLSYVSTFACLSNTIVVSMKSSPSPLLCSGC